MIELRSEQARVFKLDFSAKICIKIWKNWRGAKNIKLLFGVCYNFYFFHTYIFYVYGWGLTFVPIIKVPKWFERLEFLKLLGSSLQIGKIWVSQLRWKVRWHLTFDLMLEFGYFVSYDSHIENQTKVIWLVFQHYMCNLIFWILNNLFLPINFCCVKSGWDLNIATSEEKRIFCDFWFTTSGGVM